MTKVKLSELISPNFYEVHNAIKLKTHDEFWLKGGRGSTKSSFCPIQIVKGIIADPSANAICFRKVSNTIRDSIHAKFRWAIAKLGVAHLFNANISPSQITYIPTGQKIIFKGLDDDLKVKSIALEKGYFKYLWFEEANEFDGIEEIRSVEQSVLRGGEEFVELLTYNPPEHEEHWINQEAQVKAANKMIHHSTYLEAPPEWLGTKFITKAENLKRANFEKYRHEYLGESVGDPEQIIFSGHYEVCNFEIETDHNKVAFKRFFQGLDFGAASHPSVAVRCYIKFDDEGRKFLYITHEAWGLRVPINKLSALLSKIPDFRKWITKADCSRPELINYLAEPYDEMTEEKGFNVYGCEKWQGSVDDGIEYLKGFDMIYIHSSCVHTAEEFSKYSYKKDKITKRITMIPIKEWDHCIDGIRYAIDDYIKNSVESDYTQQSDENLLEEENEILDQDSW